MSGFLSGRGGGAITSRTFATMLVTAPLVIHRMRCPLSAGEPMACSECPFSEFKLIRQVSITFQRISTWFNVLVPNFDFRGLRDFPEIIHQVLPINHRKGIPNYHNLSCRRKQSGRVAPYPLNIGTLDKIPRIPRCKSLLLVGKRDQRFPLVELLVSRQELFELKKIGWNLW